MGFLTGGSIVGIIFWIVLTVIIYFVGLKRHGNKLKKEETIALS